MLSLAIFKPFGIDFFCLGRKFLVYNLVSRNLKIKYRRSVIGIFWTILGPISMSAVYYFVFKVILKVQVPHYLILILSGVLPWHFFSQSIMEGVESIVANWGLVSKVPIPLQIFTYVGAVTNLLNLTFALPVLLGAALISGVSLGPALILLPFYLGSLFLITYSISLMFSIGYVYFRDLRHILTIVMQIWFYATPVIYSDRMIPAKYSWILFVNPVGKIFAGLHHCLMDGEFPPANDLLPVVGWVIALFLASVLVYKKYNHELVEKL